MVRQHLPGATCCLFTSQHRVADGLLTSGDHQVDCPKKVGRPVTSNPASQEVLERRTGISPPPLVNSTP